MSAEIDHQAGHRASSTAAKDRPVVTVLDHLASFAVMFYCLLVEIFRGIGRSIAALLGPGKSLEGENVLITGTFFPVHSRGPVSVKGRKERKT
jgi:hypothetical protein